MQKNLCRSPLCVEKKTDWKLLPGLLPLERRTEWIKAREGILLVTLVTILHLLIFESCICTAAAKSVQSCPTLPDPTDGNPPGSAVSGILQARTMEWVATSFSNSGKWKVKVKSLSRVRLLVTPWTVAHQSSPSMGFSRQEYWSGVPRKS